MLRMAMAVAWATALVMSAANAAAQAAPCTGQITRVNLIPCVLTASLTVEQERAGLIAAHAREVAVSPLLPANPVLALQAGRRTSPSGASLDWSATLSQELELAGQRGARRAAAAAETQAQSQRVRLARREAATAAWIAFFETLAAREQQRLARQAYAAASALATAARARAEQGLIAPVDADIADASALRAELALSAAERQAANSESALRSLLGLDPNAGALSLVGELTPLGAADNARVADRPELAALAAESLAQRLHAEALRRSRVPSPTLSLFAQKDSFDEHVLGGGVAIPIPLPGGVGRTYAGEIAEAEALARRAAVERARMRRELELERTVALEALRSRAADARAFTAERLARAEASLVALGQEVQAARLPVRDAIVAQQSLIELLLASVEARRAWCLASIELARAAGVALEDGALP